MPNRPRQLLLDMVHDNPGEEPVETSFRDPNKLASYGYDGQVFKHINCVIRFDKLGLDIFPEKSQSRRWLDRWTLRINREIRRAKETGLLVFYHIDLFVLPKVLVEFYEKQICDHGNITIDKPKTLEIHQLMFEELFERFSQVDGLIIRSGQTYLVDTPHHTGNGPVFVGNSPVGYAKNSCDRSKTIAPAGFDELGREKEKFVSFINFMRQEICVRHNRWCIIRTWDTNIDRFHANRQYYLDVTDRIKPHPKLMFSAKHTQTDFLRTVKLNPTLACGKHPQMIEIMCQREYEGKGAFPNYVMNEVIEGAEDLKSPKGLRDIINHPNIRGIYTWSRGGGWYGPYIKNELWCELNAYVISKWAKAVERSEESIFNEYAEQIGFKGPDTERFRKLCLLSAQAVLKSHYCFDGDKTDFSYLFWTRDDFIGGTKRLANVFARLYEHDNIDKAIAEKAQAVDIYRTMEHLVETLDIQDSELVEFIETSVTYGRIYSSILHQGWIIMLLGYKQQRSNCYDKQTMQRAINEYDKLWEQFRSLEKHNPHCATIYKGSYWHWPGSEAAPGIDETVDKYRDNSRFIRQIDK